MSLAARCPASLSALDPGKQGLKPDDLESFIGDDRFQRLIQENKD